MKELNLKEVSQYVEQNIGVFHQKRIQRLDGLKLSEVLKRKNPYIFKAKYVLTSEQIINKFTKEFANSFCKDNGEIDWDKLVRFNSATSTQRIARRAKVRLAWLSWLSNRHKAAFTIQGECGFMPCLAQHAPQHPRRFLVNLHPLSQQVGGRFIAGLLNRRED